MKKLPKTIGGIIVLILAGLGYLKLDDDENANKPTETVQQRVESTGQSAPSKPAVDEADSVPREVDEEDLRRYVVEGPSGPTDIKPTLDRIEQGIENSHRNDGSVFQNREKLLPIKAYGYYHEYVHPTPGQSGPGAQRVVLGEEGEIYYTADHYKSFQRVE